MIQIIKELYDWKMMNMFNFLKLKNMFGSCVFFVLRTQKYI